MSSRRGYTVVPPNGLHGGKTYAEWMSDWYNWFLSEDPDDHNQGPVVFLKSYPSPRKLKAKAPDIESVETYNKSSFLNYPNLMVGNDKIEIFDDQAILAPIMGANMDADEPGMTEEYMRKWVRNAIDNGDNPPKSYQLIINGEPIFEDDNALAEYRFETPLFHIMVPEAEFGASLKDFMEIPYKPGTYDSIADGYFVLIKDLKKSEYKIHSYAQGSTYGGKHRYWSEYIYHINVLDSAGRTKSPTMGLIPDRFTGLLGEELKTKLDEGEITAGEYKEFTELINQTRKKQQSVVNFEKEVKGVLGKIGHDKSKNKIAKIIKEIPKQTK